MGRSRGGAENNDVSARLEARSDDVPHARVVWRGTPPGASRPHWVFGLGALAGLLGAGAGFASLALGYWSASEALDEERKRQPPAIVAVADDRPAERPEHVGATIALANEGGPIRDVTISERAFATIRIVDPGSEPRIAMIPLATFYDDRALDESGGTSRSPTFFRGRSNTAARWLERTGAVVAHPDTRGVLVQLSSRVLLRIEHTDFLGSRRVSYVEPTANGGRRVSTERGAELSRLWTNLRREGLVLSDFRAPLSPEDALSLADRFEAEPVAATALPA